MAKKIEANFFQAKLNQINSVLNSLEKELDKALSSFRKKKDVSSKKIRKNLDEIINKLGAQDILTTASEKAGGLKKDIQKMADGVLKTLKSFDIKKTDSFFDDVKIQLDDIVGKLQKSNVVHTVWGRAQKTQERILNVLKVPSQKDLKDLNKKVDVLEKKIKTISRKAA